MRSLERRWYQGWRARQGLPGCTEWGGGLAPARRMGR